eukprot:191053-Pleurochrysis_carterae.AAC.1
MFAPDYFALEWSEPIAAMRMTQEYPRMTCADGLSMFLLWTGSHTRINQCALWVGSTPSISRTTRPSTLRRLYTIFFMPLCEENE